MKRILVVVFFVLGLALMAVPYARAQWGWGVAIGSGMQQQMEVRNNSGFYCEITAANARVAVLAPGERIIDPDRKKLKMKRCRCGPSAIKTVRLSIMSALPPRSFTFCSSSHPATVGQSGTPCFAAQMARVNKVMPRQFRQRRLQR